MTSLCKNVTIFNGILCFKCTVCNLCRLGAHQTETKEHVITGAIFFIVKQPPLRMKICKGESGRNVYGRRFFFFFFRSPTPVSYYITSDCKALTFFFPTAKGIYQPKAHVIKARAALVLMQQNVSGGKRSSYFLRSCRHGSLGLNIYSPH